MYLSEHEKVPSVLCQVHMFGLTNTKVEERCHVREYEALICRPPFMNEVYNEQHSEVAFAVDFFAFSGHVSLFGLLQHVPPWFDGWC